MLKQQQHTADDPVMWALLVIVQVNVFVIARTEVV